MSVCCSAGIGRTGVFIGAEIGMQQLDEKGEVDILKIVSTLRQDRGGMVQTKDQYLFLYQVSMVQIDKVKSRVYTLGKIYGKICLEILTINFCFYITITIYT